MGALIFVKASLCDEVSDMSSVVCIMLVIAMFSEMAMLVIPAILLKLMRVCLISQPSINIKVRIKPRPPYPGLWGIGSPGSPLRSEGKAFKSEGGVAVLSRWG